MQEATMIHSKKRYNYQLNIGKRNIGLLPRTRNEGIHYNDRFQKGM